MNEQTYPFQTKKRYGYEFDSVSEEKTIKKIVLITQTNNPKMYNLALLDDLENGELSDISESKNKDLRTVLATVFKIIEDFLAKVPDVYVLFRGSDERRQRLYRIVITRELSQISKKYIIYGGIKHDDREKTVHIFRPDTQYEFYIIKKL